MYIYIFYVFFLVYLIWEYNSFIYMKYKYYDIGCWDIGDFNWDIYVILIIFFWIFINFYKDMN